MPASRLAHCSAYLVPTPAHTRPGLLQGFLTLRGSAYRRSRKASPLANTYRQWCDALAAACVLVEQDSAGGLDTVLVDLAPLRSLQLQEVRCQTGQAVSRMIHLFQGALKWRGDA